jgi:hypothetical protein
VTIYGQIPDSRSRRDRSYCYDGDRGGGVLVVSGDSGGVYLLEWEQPDPEQPLQPPTALVARQDDADAAVYSVRLGPKPCCDCWGFRRWNRCKHSSAIADIAAAVGICENRGDGD